MSPSGSAVAVHAIVDHVAHAGDVAGDDGEPVLERFDRRDRQPSLSEGMQRMSASASTRCTSAASASRCSCTRSREAVLRDARAHFARISGPSPMNVSRHVQSRRAREHIDEEERILLRIEAADEDEVPRPAAAPAAAGGASLRSMPLRMRTTSRS